MTPTTTLSSNVFANKNNTHNRVNRVKKPGRKTEYKHNRATLNDFYYYGEPTVYPLIEYTEPCESNQIVIFDWDDTLYPATSLIKKHNQYVQHDAKACYKINGSELQKLSELVLDLLNIYISIYGNSNVFIITNGEQNWVLQSLQIAIDYCEKHGIKNHKFKCIFELILWGKITTISANYLYSNQYPKQTMMWKYFVFQQIITKRFAINNGQQCFVVCIGDSLDEFNASKKVILSSPNFKNVSLHRLQLISKPSIDEMNQQFELIISLAPVFEQHHKNITIDYAKEKAKFLHRRKNI